jgi:hypothetical protein
MNFDRSRKMWIGIARLVVFDVRNGPCKGVDCTVDLRACHELSVYVTFRA